jgi:anaerobic magnesium-protoporphyrin IX monomethyl ester cyclase
VTNSRSVLLISLLNNTENSGLRSIHASLLSKGHDAHILFYTSEDPSYFGGIADFVNERGIDCVGMSVMSPFYDLAAGLSQTLRKRCSHRVPVVWGGIHPTIDPGSCRGHADYCCIGEGEHAIAGFLEHWDGKTLTQAVPGMAAPESQEDFRGVTIHDLEALPIPRYLPASAWVTHNHAVTPLTRSLMRKHNRYRGSYLPIMTSRGCPFSCSYCCNGLLQQIHGKKIRKRSPESVMTEIEDALASAGHKFSYISIHDDCFTAHSTEWLETFVRYLKPVQIPLAFRAIPQFVTPEKLTLLKEAPVGMVVLGMQSGSQRTLTQVYQRKHATESLLACARLLDEHDIPAVYDIIVDNPYENEEDREETVRAVSQLPRSSYISVFSLTFFKHTALYDMAKEDGYPVDAHLGKKPDYWQKDSPEVNALKVAALVGERHALMILRNPEGSRKVLLKGLCHVTARVLEPLRHLRMLYLSCGRRHPEFLRQLFVHARDYAYRYFSLSRINRMAH